jgi:hypothetical protein
MLCIFNIMSAVIDKLQEVSIPRQRPFVAAAVLAVLLAGPALAQHPAPSTTTANLQGNDSAAWAADSHMHAFYDLSKATLGHGAVPAAEVDAYEQKAYAIFREFGASRGMPPAAMQDHLKLIPRQVVQISKEDPHVFDSYDRFWEAMVGPP